MAAYLADLAAGRDPVALVLAESGLPGPRGNLELVAALAASGDEATLLRWSAIPASEAPGDPDARWIVRENLGKSQMRRLDADWLAGVSGTAAGSPGG